MLSTSSAREASARWQRSTSSPSHPRLASCGFPLLVQPKLSPLLQGGKPPAIERDLGNLDYSIPFGNNREPAAPLRWRTCSCTDPDAAAALLRWVSGKRSIKGTARG